MSCSIGHRHGLDPVLLWLWRRPAAAALIGPLAWELPYAGAVALKIKSKKQTNKKALLFSFLVVIVFFFFLLRCPLFHYLEFFFSVFLFHSSLRIPCFIFLVFTQDIIMCIFLLIKLMWEFPLRCSGNESD